MFRAMETEIDDWMREWQRCFAQERRGESGCFDGLTRLQPAGTQGR
jgi:hypothetical protein